jgi:hypothetical protein
MADWPIKCQIFVEIARQIGNRVWWKQPNATNAMFSGPAVLKMPQRSPPGHRRTAIYHVTKGPPATSWNTQDLHSKNKGTTGVLWHAKYP